MEEGFIPDLTYGAVMQLTWQPGEPEPAKFLGLKNGVKVNVNETVKITAHRCSGCGLLKLYARPTTE
jgi:hypothetical protein